MRMIALAVAATLVGATTAYAQVNTPTVTAVGFIEFQETDELLATDLLGRAITNLSEETLGTVNNILYTFDGQATALIVGVGGFLGIGVKDVAIAYDAVRITDDGAEIRLIVDATREALDAATGFQTLDALGLTPMVPAEPATPVPTPEPVVPTVAPAAGAVVTPEPAPVITLAPVPPAAVVEPAPTVTPVPDAAPAAAAPVVDNGPMVIIAPPMVIAAPAAPAPTTYVAAQATGEVLVNDMIGHPVYNLAGEALGNIDNVLQTRDGRITGVIVGVGGFLGIGVKDVAISIDVINIGVIDGEWRFVFDADRAALDAAPAFQRLP